MRGKLILLFFAMIISSMIIIMPLSVIGYGVYGNLRIGDEFPSRFPRDFARSFITFIEFENDEVVIREEGKELLEERGAWLQILDENGMEIYEINRPIEAPTNYTVAQGVWAQMFPDRIDGYTIFINSADHLSYILGFSSSEVSTLPFAFNQTMLISFFVFILMISVVVFGLMALIFGGRITQPLIKIMKGLQALGEKDYSTRYEEKGMYASLFGSLNRLAENLESSVKEKQKVEKMREEWVTKQLRKIYKNRPKFI